MVALAVVAIGSAASLSLGSSLSQGTAYLEQRTLARWLAMDLITEYQLTDHWPGGADQGEILFAGRQWRWSGSLLSADNQPEQVEISVTVEASDGSKFQVSGYDRTNAA